MLEGKLITIPALGHQNKGKSSFTGSSLFVLMSQCGNNNELALQHGGFRTTWSLAAKGLLKAIPRGVENFMKWAANRSAQLLYYVFTDWPAFTLVFGLISVPKHMMRPASWPLKLALPCASVRAPVAIVAVAYYAEFCRFLSLLALLIFVDHCFGRLFCQLSA